MSSLTKIETAIHKLSVSDQKIIALHLGEHLVGEEPLGDCAAADEGIRFLPQYDACPAPREVRGAKHR